MLTCNFLKLQTEGQVSVDAPLGAKQFYDVAIEVQTARLVAGAHILVEIWAQVVGDLIPQPDQEFYVPPSIVVERALRYLEAMGQVPVFDLAVLKPIDHSTVVLHSEVPILDMLFPVVAVEKVCPRNHFEDDEGLRLEVD